jgi:hypothetical protein
MALVYDAGSRRKLIRAMILMSIPVGLLFCWLALLGWTSPPAVGERAWERPFVLLLGFGAGLGTIAGMLVYGRCYIGQLEVEDDGTARVRTIAPFGWPERVLRADDVIPGEYHDGFLRANGQTINAPWYTVRIRGRRLPLILDPQGDVLDADRTERALGIEPGELAFLELSPPPFESTPVPKPVLSEKERKRIKQARRRR